MSFNQSGAGRFQFDLANLTSQGVNDILKAGGEPMAVGRVGGDDEDSSQFSMSPQDDQETDYCVRTFENWTQTRQTEFVEQLIARMSFHQHEHLYSILMPMLQRDFITVLPSKGPGTGSGWCGVCGCEGMAAVLPHNFVLNWSG